jgi:hypothetical protein
MFDEMPSRRITQRRASLVGMIVSALLAIFHTLMRSCTVLSSGVRLSGVCYSWGALVVIDNRGILNHGTRRSNKASRP